MSSRVKVSEGKNVRGSEESDKNMRESDKERKGKRKAAVTKEEKNALKEKDRLRRAMKKTSHVDGRTLPRERRANRPEYDETIANR